MARVPHNNNPMKKMSINILEANTTVGQINVPQAMVDQMGWERIEQDVLASFRLMLAFQPRESLAWGLAVNNVYSTWNGSRTLH